MNQRYFANQDLEKVFQDAEERLRREREQAEKDRRKSELEGKIGRKKGGIQPSQAEQPQQTRIITPVTLNDLIFEPVASRKSGTGDKELFYFNPSQERLVRGDYERHPLASEAFELICAYLDDQKRPNKFLSQEQTEVAEDMLEGYGEFFAQAVKTEQTGGKILGLGKKTRKLFVYELVTSLSRNANNTGYTEEGMEHSGSVKEFDISDLALGSYYYYKKIYEQHDDLVAYFTSRSFEQLPEEIKENGGIYMPKPDNVWPVGRGYYCRFYVDCSNYGASRGVRARSKNKV